MVHNFHLRRAWLLAILSVPVVAILAVTLAMGQVPQVPAVSNPTMKRSFVLTEKGNYMELSADIFDERIEGTAEEWQLLAEVREILVRDTSQLP